MHSQIFLVAAMALLVFGCSSKSKTASTTTTPSTAEVQLKLPTPAAEKSQTPPKNEVACERGAEVRTLRVETLQPKGCNLWYSTYSSVKPTAWSSHANTHCEQVRSNIRQKLTDAGFKCSDNVTAAPTSAPAVSATPAKAVATPTPAPATAATPEAAQAATPVPSKVSSPSPTPAASPDKAAASPTPAQSK